MEDYTRLVTIYSLQDMYIVRPLLDEGEVDYYVTNESFIQLDPLSSIASGGMDILVTAADFQRAYTILNDAGYIETKVIPVIPDAATDEPVVRTENTGQPFCCPFCHSENIKSERTKIGMILGYLLMGMPLPLGFKIYRCFNCGKLFDKKNSEYRYN